MKRLLVANLAINSLIFMPEIYNCPQITSLAHAEVQTYTGVGEYLMNGKETPEIAIENAKMYAERNAQEQAGVFLSSRTEVKNGITVKDEIETFTAGILKITNTNTEVIPLTGEASGWIKYRVTVTANIDTNALNDSISQWMQGNEEKRLKAVAENTAFKKIIDEQRKKIAKLEKDLNNIKTIQDKKRIKEEFMSIGKVSAYQAKLKEAIFAKDSDKIRIYTEAIKINPNGSEAYFWRALSLDDRKQEIIDLSRAIEIDSDYADAYYFRAGRYSLDKNYELALLDYTKVIELQPDRIDAYKNRGNTYYELGRYEEAISDYTKAIERKPNYSFNYASRAMCYKMANDYDNAIVDYIKYLQMENPRNVNNPRLHTYYNFLGDCYMAIGESAKAREAYMMGM